MRIEVGAVNKLSQVALAVAALAYGYWTLVPTAGSTGTIVERADAAQLAAGYGLTMLAFAAFPHRRRTDLIKVVILASALMEIARYLLGHGLDPLNPVAETVGAIAVLVPSFIERFRSLTRADPYEPFSMIYPNDRRRLRTQALSPEADSSAAQAATASH
jgi:hypothetical protein